MTLRPDTDDYQRLFLEDVPLLDLRAQVEFAQGAFPSASNRPILNDAERHQVGISYRRQGQEAAIALGNQLVSGAVKERRVQAWKDFASDYPEGYLYCYRGGLRSRIGQQWLGEAGSPYPMVVGGYKALRRFLIDNLEAQSQALPLVVVGGMTGTGKTDLLVGLERSVDLEGLANHRGSSFGRHLDGQPAAIDFQNRLSIRLLKLARAGLAPVAIEDEGKMIGSLSIPMTLQEKMQQSPIVQIEAPLEYRVQCLQRGYVEESYAEHVAVYKDDAMDYYRDYLLEALGRIHKRLGGLRYQRIRAMMKDALSRQAASGNILGHRHWIEALLRDYYDPMYEYQLEAKKERIRFAGSFEAVREYLQEEYGIQ